MESLNIQLVTPSSPLRAITEKFIADQYYKHMKVLPTIPEIIFAAIRDGAMILATIGLEFSPEEAPAPFEELFLFNWTTLPLIATRTTSAHYVRWNVEDKSLSNKILYAATVYAIEQGKRFGWCEVKPTVAKRLRTLGVELYEVTEKEMRVENIPESVRSYYTSVPSPGLYQMDLLQMREALK